jgi:hypothetical protein
VPPRLVFSISREYMSRGVRLFLFSALSPIHSNIFPALSPPHAMRHCFESRIEKGGPWAALEWQERR